MPGWLFDSVALIESIGSLERGQGSEREFE
jgi:hypothetical protein